VQRNLGGQTRWTGWGIRRIGQCGYLLTVPFKAWAQGSHERCDGYHDCRDLLTTVGAQGRAAPMRAPDDENRWSVRPEPKADAKADVIVTSHSPIEASTAGALACRSEGPLLFRQTLRSSPVPLAPCPLSEALRLSHATFIAQHLRTTSYSAPIVPTAPIRCI